MKKIKILDVEYFYVIEKHYCEHGDCYETKFYSTTETELTILSKVKQFFGIKNNLKKKPKYLFSFFNNIESTSFSKETIKEVLETFIEKYLVEQKRIMEIEKGELI